MLDHSWDKGKISLDVNDLVQAFKSVNNIKAVF